MSLMSTQLAAASESVLLTFCIHDNGIGMLEAQIERMVTPLYRGNPAVDGRYAGAGSGLTLVQQYVSDSKGEIACESSPGAGSTFKVTIPLKRSV